MRSADGSLVLFVGCFVGELGRGTGKDAVEELELTTQATQVLGNTALAKVLAEAEDRSEMVYFDEIPRGTQALAEEGEEALLYGYLEEV